MTELLVGASYTYKTRSHEPYSWFLVLKKDPLPPPDGPEKIVHIRCYNLLWRDRDYSEDAKNGTLDWPDKITLTLHEDAVLSSSPVLVNPELYKEQTPENQFMEFPSHEQWKEAYSFYTRTIVECLDLSEGMMIQCLNATGGRK